MHTSLIFLCIYFCLKCFWLTFFKPFFRGRCTNSAVVPVCWVWCPACALRWSLYNSLRPSRFFLYCPPLFYKLYLHKISILIGHLWFCFIIKLRKIQAYILYTDGYILKSKNEVASSQILPTSSLKNSLKS
jgi:hypothetical protein